MTSVITTAPAAEAACALTAPAAEAACALTPPVAQTLPPPPSGPADLARLALHRHLPERGRDVALRIVDAGGHARSISYARLADQARRFSGALDMLGVLPGEWVLTLLPRRWELHVAMLGTLWHGSVFTALCSERGPGAALRAAPLSRARLLVTTPELLADHASTIGAGGVRPLLVGPGHRDLGLTDLMGLPHLPRPEPRRGGTGPTAIVRAGTRERLGPNSPGLLGGLGPLGTDDVVWFASGTGWRCADPCVDLPALTAGAATVVDEGEPDADRWHRTLDAERVTVWCLSAEDLRWLRWTSHTSAPARRHPSLRRIVVVGTAPDDLRGWAEDRYGVRVDTTG